MTLSAPRERERESNSSSNSSRWLLATLVFLCLAISGLVAGIVAINLSNSSSDSQTSDMGTNWPLSETSTTYTEALEILDSDTPDSYAEALAYFDAAIASSNDPETIFSLKTARINMLLENEYYTEALSYLDQLSQNNLDANQQYTIYIYYKLAYAGIGDSEKSNEYSEKAETALLEINKELFDEQSQNRSIE